MKQIPPRVRQICERLSDVQGGSLAKRCEDPLDSLIATILSQNTSDINSGRAFERLKQAFPTWEEALRAPRTKIEKAITPGGLAKIKSQRIQEVLAILAEKNNGNVSLDWLNALSNDEAREFLCSLPGVGMKTASCVLLFALKRPVCPVDTHVLRVAKRIGLIHDKMDADKATFALEAMLPDDCMFIFHVGLIRIGRTVCRPQKPNCPACRIVDLCEHGNNSLI